jgi:cytochrome c peroxidase
VEANEMFSDFEEHVIAVPQVAPGFGVNMGHVNFDGPAQNKDFGLEQISGNSADRYKFRTAPLRNLALAPAFLHNGAFARLDDAIYHHLNVRDLLLNCDPVKASLPADLTHLLGPRDALLERVDLNLKSPIELTPRALHDLVVFVRGGLFDERAKPEELCKLVPANVPSGMPVMPFPACR